MTLERTLSVIFLLLLIHSVVAFTTGWTHSLSDEHAFRQAQTAITVDYLLKGGPWIAYEMPVLGPPWSIPFEFPLYEWITALVVLVFRMSVEQAGRAVSCLFFYGTLIPGYFFLRRLELSKAQTLTFLSLMLASPLYLFWSRTVMIESCALFFSVLYLALAAEYLNKPKTLTGALLLVSGILAAMVKITTFFGFALCCGLLLIADGYHRRGQGTKNYLAHLGFTMYAGVLPVLAGYGWSLYAEAQRVQNPLAGFTSLSALSEFTFGTAHLRLSPEFWQVIWSRSIKDILGSNLLILPILLCLPLIRRERRLCVAAAAVFVAVLLTFTNLHFVHNYYQYANGVFLIAAVAFCIAGLIAIGGRARITGVTLFAISLLFGLHQYRVSFAVSQEHDNTALRGIAAAIQTHSQPDDAVMVYGMDWSAELLHASNRRGLMIRDGVSMEDPNLQKARDNLGSHKLGAMVFCLAERPNEAETRLRTCKTGFQEEPVYMDEFCALYLPSTMPKPPSSCTASGSPADSPINGNDRDSFENRFQLKSPSMIAKLSLGSIDRINDIQNPKTLPDEQHPLPIESASGLMLEGWLAESADGPAFDEVYAILDGRLIRMTIRTRPDVSAAYKNSRLDRSGFHVEIRGNALRKGVLRVDLIGLIKQDLILYRFPKPVYIHVR
jgi:hypothetical protein